MTEGSTSFTVPGVDYECTTAYKIVGDIKSATPLIFLHGGPGAGYDDHFCIAQPLKEAGIPTIWFDQLGCGDSSRLSEKAEEETFWTFDVFCTQLDSLIDALDLRTGFYLLGHSWGGIVASIYAARRPRGLKKLIIANSYGGGPESHEELLRLFKALPVDDEIMKVEASGNCDHPAYQEAAKRFYNKHFCTLDPWPQVLLQGKWEHATQIWPAQSSTIRKPPLMRNWSARDTAGNINVPTLLISGRFDNNNDVIMGPWFQTIPRVKWVEMAQSAHFPALEEPERYVRVLSMFLNTEM